jgi:hypothetical protein
VDTERLPLGDALQGCAQIFGTLFKTSLLFGRKLRLQDLCHAGSTYDAGQRQGDTELALIRADRDSASLVAQDHFSNPSRDDTDAILAGVVALNNGDVGVADFFLDLRANVAEFLVVLLQEAGYRHAGNAS